MRTDTGDRGTALRREYEAALADLAALRTELGRLTASARSADRSVHATVGPDGRLTGLEIDSEAMARLSPRDLAARVVEASERAVEAVRARVGSAVAAALPAALRGLVAADGTVDPQPMGRTLGTPR